MKNVKELKLKELKSLKEMEIKALKEELEVSAKNLYVLNMKKTLGEQKQTHLIKVLKRYIAQIKTIASLKGLNIN
ncbi:MAG: 50S ribosomal protein L29 [Candidatus Peribacteria bacterium]|jgi:ribosomal protein L29|nr:50S ribosomal protein L29 [Candidatus Peribacteria bacterium]